MAPAATRRRLACRARRVRRERGRRAGGAWVRRTRSDGRAPRSCVRSARFVSSTIRVGIPEADWADLGAAAELTPSGARDASSGRRTSCPVDLAVQQSDDPLAGESSTRHGTAQRLATVPLRYESGRDGRRSRLGRHAGAVTGMRTASAFTNGSGRVAAARPRMRVVLSAHPRASAAECGCRECEVRSASAWLRPASELRGALLRPLFPRARGRVTLRLEVEPGGDGGAALGVAQRPGRRHWRGLRAVRGARSRTDGQQRQGRSRCSAVSVVEPGSAVASRRVRPGSARRAAASKTRSRSPTRG
jgi:hypothetical protein